MLVMGMGMQTNEDKKPKNQKGNNGVKEANTINTIGSSEKIASNEISYAKNNKDLLSKESRLNDEETQIFLSKLLLKDLLKT